MKYLLLETDSMAAQAVKSKHWKKIKYSSRKLFCLNIGSIWKLEKIGMQEYEKGSGFYFRIEMCACGKTYKNIILFVDYKFLVCKCYYWHRWKLFEFYVFNPIWIVKRKHWA